jgi:hypothetical protein
MSLLPLVTGLLDLGLYVQCPTNPRFTGRYSTIVSENERFLRLIDENKLRIFQ